MRANTARLAARYGGINCVLRPRVAVAANEPALTVDRGGEQRRTARPASRINVGRRPPEKRTRLYDRNSAPSLASIP